MIRARAESWRRTAETALLALVFLAPLAAHGRTWDPAALRTALVQAAALTAGAAWLLKGLARGRWEAASGSAAALVPLAALAAWTLARFAAAPFKAAALPELTLALSAWTLFTVALLELGGARHAARLAFWAAAAAALAAADAARRFGAAAAAPMSPDQLAALAAAALPAALALRLDPEASPVRRVLSWAAAAALALAAARSGSAGGLAVFVLSALLFAAAAAGLLRGAEARRAALAALGCAALAAAAGAPSGSLRAALPQDRIGAALFAWTALAAAAAGWRAALDLSRRGAAAEAGYAAAFASLFAAWALGAGAGLVPSSGPAAWLAWTAAGVAAGLAPLARARGVVRALPLPFGEDARRLLQGPVLLAAAGLLAWPGLWLASDVRFNRAVAEARAGSLDAALADAGRVWPGSGVYAPSLYLRGRVLADQGKPREALDAYARLDGVAPGLYRVHAREAEAYAALEDWTQSARERERHAALQPADLGNLTAWAEAARAAGDLPAARRAAARARALAPGDESVRVQLAANALLERKLAQAGGARRRDGRKGLALKPKPR